MTKFDFDTTEDFKVTVGIYCNIYRAVTSMMTSQILKFVISLKTQNILRRKLFFLQIKKNNSLYMIKGYNMAKNNFVAKVTFQ